MQQNKLYVGNLSYSIDESHLDTLFTTYGEIDEINLIRDRESGRSKGFAFITFAKQLSAENALEQNGKDLDGRSLKVNMAKERTAQSGGRKGGNSRQRW